MIRRIVIFGLAFGWVVPTGAALLLWLKVATLAPRDEFEASFRHLDEAVALLCLLVGLFWALVALGGYAIHRAIKSEPRPGYCSACRYDLTGNVSGVCPECGTEIARP